MRTVSKDWGKGKLTKVTHGHVSAYFLVGVKWGTSQAEIDGTSLVNFANVEADLFGVWTLLD